MQRFFSKPKGILMIILVLLAILAGFGNGLTLVGSKLLEATLAAMAVDGVILRIREGQWSFPSGAFLTGMIVAMILSPGESWYVVSITAAIGVASKYLFQIRTTNVFNPAALALVVTFYIFHPGHDWWGAMADLGIFGVAVLGVAGVLIAYRINKIPLVISFLGSYFLLFTITAILGDRAPVAEIYRTPDLQAILFFAFFMVTDPPTSPPRHHDQLIYGAIVATVGYATFALIGAAYFMLIGLLVANGLEAWRRTISPTPLARSCAGLGAERAEEERT